MKLNIQISVPRSKTKSYDPRSITIGAASISFGMEALKELGNLDLGDYIMAGSFGKDVYVAKRPVGLPGYKLNRQTKASNRLNISAVDLQQDKFRGMYELGDTINDVVKGEDGTKNTVNWRKLVRIVEA